MIRKRRRQPGIGVALFPFLAVLVCTMGSLIVLLVMVVQQARLHAEDRAETARSDRTEKIDELRQQEEHFVWRRELLEPKLDEIVKDLANKRNELSHLEDHIRKLQEQGKRLAQQLKSLEQLEASKNDADSQVSQRLEALREQLAATKEEVEKLTTEANARKRSHAIIPYDGPNGTRRQPVFLECVGSRIILQPEQIQLTAEDFRGGVGPGNPLDAALRAVREYYADVQQVEPYPLLVVRPSGTQAYAMARVAMSSWDDEFGYELIDADLKLTYPKSDARLAELLQQSIRTARQRQTLLMSAMPRVRSNAGYIVGRRGGLQRIGPPSSGAARDGRGVGFGPGGEANSTGGGPGHSSQIGADARRLGQTDAGSDRPQDSSLVDADGKPHSADGGTSENEAADSNGGVEGGDPNGGPNGSPNAEAGQASSGASRAASLAGAKGANWAIGKKDAPEAQGFTRPVRVRLDTDRIVILPSRGESFLPVATQLEQPMTADDVERFVKSLQAHTESWGIAALGGYWIPVLNIESAPETEAEIELLEDYLKNSGIQLKRSPR